MNFFAKNVNVVVDLGAPGQSYAFKFDRLITT